MELIEGEILLKPPTGNNHTWGIARLNILLMDHRPRDYFLQTQSTIHLAEGFSPDPDYTLPTPEERLYLHEPAAASDVLLIIEVASTSLRYDLQVKANLYARAGVPELWVIDLTARVVHRLTDPSPQGYLEQNAHQDGDTLTPTRIPGLTLPVSEMVPSIHDVPAAGGRPG